MFAGVGRLKPLIVVYFPLKVHEYLLNYFLSPGNSHDLYLLSLAQVFLLFISFYS
jgi:hypothetical protein